MSGCVTLSRHTRELTHAGVSRVVDEFTVDPDGPRLVVRLNRSTGEIDARVISGTGRGKDLKLWARKHNATPADVAGLLVDLINGAFRALAAPLAP